MGPELIDRITGEYLQVRAPRGRGKSLERVHGLARTALQGGARFIARGTLRWEIAGSCENPVSVFQYARPNGGEQQMVCSVVPGELVNTVRTNVRDRDVLVAKDTAMPLEVQMEVACGKCDACLDARRRLWTAKAITECNHNRLMGTRVWFVTLTCSPASHYLTRAEAVKRFRERSVIFEELRGEEQFRAIDAIVYSHIKKMLKRLRKGSVEHAPALFRFLCVTEKHKSGEPHYHLLIHELQQDRPIRKAALKWARWPLGRINEYKLLDITGNSGVYYCCKYLSKNGARVRASINYGSPELEIPGSSILADGGGTARPIVGTTTSTQCAL